MDRIPKVKEARPARHVRQQLGGVKKKNKSQVNALIQTVITTRWLSDLIQIAQLKRISVALRNAERVSCMGGFVYFVVRGQRILGAVEQRSKRRR